MLQSYRRNKVWLDAGLTFFSDVSKLTMLSVVSLARAVRTAHGSIHGSFPHQAAKRDGQIVIAYVISSKHQWNRLYKHLSPPTGWSFSVCETPVRQDHWLLSPTQSPIGSLHSVHAALTATVSKQAGGDERWQAERHTVIFASHCLWHTPKYSRTDSICN